MFIKRIYIKIHQVISLAAVYVFDFRRFLIYSGIRLRRSKREAAAAWLTMYFHRLEKGLSFRNPRIGFGQDVVRITINGLRLYLDDFGQDRTAALCWQVLSDYFAYHLENDALNDELYALFQAINFDESCAASLCTSAARECERSKILRDSCMDFRRFAYSRFSVRDFIDEPVDIALIREAADIARKTPSVCNRQAWQLHVYQGKDDIGRVLACQGGNRGFADCIGTVLVVTATSEHFFSIVERNQGFIDGGLYSMSLVYALHALGLATCCLNLSLSPDQDKRLQEVAGLSPGEMPIMMIAVGHYPASFKVASSERRDLSETLIEH